MPKYDFEVDIKSLIEAAKGATKAIEEKKDKDVSDDMPEDEDVANPILISALDEFSERWERGVNDMIGDIEEVAGRLGKVAMNYMDYNEAAEKRMERVHNAMMKLPNSPEGRQ